MRMDIRAAERRSLNVLLAALAYAISIQSDAISANRRIAPCV